MQEVVHTDHLFSKQSNDRSGTTCLEKVFFCLNKVTHWNVVPCISSYVQLTFTVTDISISSSSARATTFLMFNNTRSASKSLDFEEIQQNPKGDSD